MGASKILGPTQLSETDVGAANSVCLSSNPPFYESACTHAPNHSNLFGHTNGKEMLPLLTL
jgi:hypothetical protein